MKKIKVLVVDDSKFIRVLFTGLLSNREDIEVVGTSDDPDEAKEMMEGLKPDVVILDVNMRDMDSINFLEHIMSDSKLPVIMASSTEEKDVETAIRALEAGAVEYIIKPNSIENYKHISEFAQQLENKIKIAVRCNIKATMDYSSHHLKSTRRPPEIKYKFAKNTLIALGAATGGVEAIRQILVRMPDNSPPMVIAQHLPSSFSVMFANRLSNITMIKVKAAKHGDKLKHGYAYVIPGDQHMQVEHDGKGSYSLCQLEGNETSIDTLFRSVSAAAGVSAVGVILSGIECEGAAGLLKMKAAGSVTIGQSPDSCIAAAMPQAAIDKGAVSEELPVHKIAERICGLCVA